MSNIFSGDAAESMLTFSRVLEASSRRSSAYSAYLSSPVNLAHTLVLMFWDIVLEMWARLVAWIGNVEPKGHRRFPYQLVQRSPPGFLRDVVVYTLIGDMFRGVRVAYADFVGYDEVAHHSGIQRPDAMAVLRRIDHQLARLERAAASAPRPYRFVLLSDHGQTQGATFRQRYDQTLGQVVTSLMEGQADTVQDVSDDGDTWGYLNAFLTETSHEGDSHTAGLARRASAGHVEGGVVQMGPSEPAQAESAVTCLASGNLGLVYFNTLPGRATYEEITRAYPGGYSRAGGASRHWLCHGPQRRPRSARLRQERRGRSQRGSRGGRQSAAPLRPSRQGSFASPGWVQQRARPADQ